MGVRRRTRGIHERLKTWGWCSHVYMLEMWSYSWVRERSLLLLSSTSLLLHSASLERHCCLILLLCEIFAASFCFFAAVCCFSLLLCNISVASFFYVIVASFFFFAGSATTHGAWAVTGDKPRRASLYSYLSRHDALINRAAL